MTGLGTAGVEQFLYYTKARNEIFDVIIPEVTELCQQGKTAALIVFLIERKTSGYHKDNADVSVEHMEAFVSGSRSDVSRARTWLIANGYIELLSGGNGLDTSNLRIVIDPQERARLKESKNGTTLEDKPAKIISLPTESTCQPQSIENAATVTDDEEVPQTPDADTVKRWREELGLPPADTNIYDTTAAAITDGEEVPQTPDSDTVEPHYQAPDPEPETSSRDFQYESALMPVTDHQTPDPTSDTSSQISENENADKASEIKGGLTDDPSRANESLVLVPGFKQEQTKSKAKKKEAFGAVCSFAKSQNFGMEDRDYAFVRWTVDAYGAEVVLEKMEIAEMQKRRSVEFANPLGWLRNALTRDYQPAKLDGEVKKAREKARRAIEKTQRENAERDEELEKWKTYREQNPNAANKARAEFLGGLGK